jgi:uncharacterized protein (TIGR02001 family)
LFASLACLGAKRRTPQQIASLGVKQMNRVTSVFFAAVMLGSAASASAADIAGNVTLATDYRFRGISQDHGKFSPAIQGGFDWSSDMGIYVGTWASNINFSEAAIETDIYGGYKGKINDDFAYDVGVLYYGYPQDGSQHLGYTEIYTSLSFFGAKVGVNYSDNYFAGSDEFSYWYANYGREIFKNLTVNLHYGYNSFATEQDGNPDGGPLGLDGEDAYSDWSIGLSTTQLGVTWALTYVDTDLDDSDQCFGDEDLCAATAVFSMSKAL